MDKEYQIVIGMNPHEWDNKEKPYSWCILKWCKATNGDGWCNYGHGWAKTSQEAWEQGKAYYDTNYAVTE